jgi:hypothetical protein
MSFLARCNRISVAEHGETGELLEQLRRETWRKTLLSAISTSLPRIIALAWQLLP